MSLAPTSPESTVFLNGDYLPASAARIGFDDLGLATGAILSERLRTVRHVPVYVAEHLQRLERGLRFMGWTVPSRWPPLDEIISEVVRLNSRSLAAEDDLAISVFLTAGDPQTGVPTLCVSTGPLPFGRWAQWWRQGVPLVVSDVRAVPGDVVPKHFKHRSRLHWEIADSRARAIDPASQALLLDHDGHVTETSSGNLFIVRDGRLLTPREDQVLPGIAQAVVLRLAGDAGLTAERADLRSGDVATADEAFLTSSTYCLLPVGAIDGAMIGRLTPGPVTLRLAEAWSRELGLDFREQTLQGCRGQ